MHQFLLLGLFFNHRLVSRLVDCRIFGFLKLLKIFLLPFFSDFPFLVSDVFVKHFPVIFDATHSVQKPAGLGTSSGGDRRFVASLAKAACAVGVAGVFIETHQDPDNAPCDGPNMININDLAGLIRSLRSFDSLAKSEANICT